MKSLLLYSGGLDSSAMLYWKRPDIALLVNYGQLTFKAEQKAAIEIAKAANIKLECIEVKCASIGSGSLTGKKFSDLNKYSEWWPFRNQFLLTLAAMYATKHDITSLMIGITKSDVFYKDSSNAFINKFNSLIKTQEGNLFVSAPGKTFNTLELIKISKIPFSILSWAHSCNVSVYPCGSCFSCKKQIEIIESLKTTKNENSAI